MLVHRRVTPNIKFAGTHLYTWVERGTVRVKCLAQEHNTMSPARARTRTARSGDERTNHRASLTSVLIDQNYVAVVVILITFKSSTETDIFVSLEYIVSTRLRNISVANYFYLHDILISFSFRGTK